VYATAHRVVRGEREGFHAFLHKHGVHYVWPQDPWNLPERDPGELLWDNTSLPRHGNRVRSYLDVIAPDTISAREIDTALTALWAQLAAEEFGPKGAHATGNDRLPNPVVYQHGSVVLRFGVELGLEGTRALEMAQLRAAVDPATARWEQVVQVR